MRWIQVFARALFLFKMGQWANWRQSPVSWPFDA
jgi:hypothetical protein